MYKKIYVLAISTAYFIPLPAMPDTLTSDTLMRFCFTDAAAESNCWRRLISESVPTVMYDFGVHYVNGDGVAQDLTKGRYWIQLAAIKGYPLAQYNLGMMLFDGAGGPQNIPCARYWLNKAAVVGGETGFMAKQLLDYVAEHNKHLAPKIIRPDSISSCQQLPDIVFPALPGVSTAPLPGNSAPIKNNPPTVNDTLQGALSSNGGAEEAKTAAPEPAQAVAEASKPEQATTTAPEPAQTVAEAPEPEQAKTAAPEPAQTVAEASEPEQAKTATPEPAQTVAEAPEAEQAKTAAPEPAPTVAEASEPEQAKTAAPEPAQTVAEAPEPEQAKTAAPEPAQAVAEASEPEQAKTAAPEPAQAVAEAPEPEQAKTATPEPVQAVAEASEPEQAKTAAPEPVQAVAEASEPEQAKTAAPEPAQTVAEASEPEQAKTAAPEPVQAVAEASEPEQAKTAAPEPAQAVAEASEPEQAKAAVPEPVQAVAETSEPEQAKTAVPEPAEAVVEESETAQAKEESQSDLEPATSYRKTVGRYLIQLGAKISGQEEEHSLTLSPPVKTEREIASREESEQAVEPMTVPEGHQDDNLLSKEFLKGSENNQKVDDLPLVIQIFELPLMHQSEPNTMEPPGTGPVDEEEALVLSESRKGLSDAGAVNGAAITEGKSVSSSSDAENKSESTTVIPPVTEAPQALKTAPVPTAHAPLNLGGDIRHASKKHYTLQLGSASQSEPLLAMARKQKLSNYLVYETQRHGQRWFVLVHGEYATMSQAKRALQQLPASFKKDSPWARSIGHVQTEL